jgi:multidrug efflux system outer membrane protein
LLQLVKKMRIGLLCFLILAVLFSACKVGPPYRRPNVVDNSWTWKDQIIKDTSYVERKSEQDTSASPRRPIVNQKENFKLDTQWWNLFEDDTLSNLIQTAFTNNPNLKTAAYRIMESRGLVNVSKANFYPVITIDPTGTKNLLSGNRPSQVSTNALPALTLNTITVPLDMSYELDVWGKFRRGVEATKATMLATEADQQVVKLGLAADVASNYFNLCLLDNQIQLFEDALKLRYENLTLTKSQYQAGITTKLDVVQAEIEVTTVESQIIDSKRNRALAENAIAVLCGVPAMNFKIPVHHGLPNVPFIPLEVPSDLLQRRPDIIEAEQQIVAANAQIGVAKAAFLPSVRISAGTYGYQSSKFDNLFSQHSNTWLGGVGISIPVFAGGRNIAQKNVAEARLKESESAYKQVVQNAFREVQDALANIEYRAQQSDVQQRALISAQSSSDMSKELYKKGLTTYLNVIIADRAVLDTKNTYIGITGQRLLYSISLIKALGGGWNEKALKE